MARVKPGTSQLYSISLSLWGHQDVLMGELLFCSKHVQFSVFGATTSACFYFQSQSPQMMYDGSQDWLLRHLNGAELPLRKLVTPVSFLL